jgi:hypothetical protein
MENESVIKTKYIECMETKSACELIAQRLSVVTTVTLTILLTNVCGTY